MVLDNESSNPPSGTARTQVRRAAIASVVGTTIEWYDFFLYNTASALIFPALFFPASSPYSGIIESFATNAVGFAARPIGAAIFGYWGDRIGRKATLIVTLLVMGIGSALVGVLPGTATLGIAAPILLVLLRVVQGLAVGGEWSGSVLIAMEWGKQGRRGVLGSFAQMGVPLGLILGTGGLTLLSTLQSKAAFDAWGWRLPFLFSLILVVVGLIIRLSVTDTPMFADVVRSGRVSRAPVGEVIRKHTKEILLSAGVRFSEQMPFYLFTSFVLSFLVSNRGFSKTFALEVVLIAAVVELVAIPFFAYLSDRVGRKRVYLTGATLMGLAAFPYFAALAGGGMALVLVAGIVALVLHAMHYGPQAAMIAESFPTHLRYGGAGLGYQLASVFAGGPAPLLATYFLYATGTVYTIAAFVVFACLVTIGCTIALPDRSKADIADDQTFVPASQPTG